MPAGGYQTPLLLRLGQRPFGKLRTGFMEAGRERLSRDTVRDATRQEIQDLKRENGELRQLVAELSLEVYRLEKRPCRCLRPVSVPTDERR